MTDAANYCPVGLNYYTQSSTRFCGTSIYSAGCTSVNFSTYGVPFTKVCGRALGYQYGSTDAFHNSGSSIESYSEAFQGMEMYGGGHDALVQENVLLSRTYVHAWECSNE